jgi:hypothetical protein
MRKGLSTLICLLLLSISLAGCLDRLLHQDESYDLGSHTYRADDTSASPTEETSDELIRIYWSHTESVENDLLWNYTTINLEVGDSMYECHTSADGESGEHCLISQDGQEHYLWETGEFLTIWEDGTDIVSSSGTNVILHIYYRGEQIPGTSEVLVQ